MAPALWGLKSLVWQKLKSSVFEDCKKEEEWKVMLLDDYTTKLLSLCCKMTDLLAEGITVCPDNLFNKIKSSCAKSIRRCKEINISFFPYESRVFTLNVPDAFYRCYSPTLAKTKDKDAVMQVMAEQIVTLCATLDENPGVRYKSGPSDKAYKLAELVEKNLENYYKTDEKSQIKAKTHSQLIIIDRGFDPVSTVLHELTFQAMAYDLLPIENDTYKQFAFEAKGRLTLESEEKLREIPKLFKEASSKRKAAEGKVSMSALTQLMKKMPLYRKEISRQVIHLNLAEDCMSKFKSNIERLCKAEQDLALGTDVEGQKVKDSMRVLLPVLLNKSHESYDKIRAILLYIFSTNGSTHILTPKRLLDEVKSLSKPKDMVYIKDE
ncbi:Syntaxin-binding protein 3 [Amazona aestiva]|uniref:Syntaxin-binding protein 3 n=1 Tax=Amazona aestiva TaxID=12930 RepID=A0A0Q3X9X5_AMAAE|nr:Syntaxin-binding protein 3 [Amazona aestiva]